MIVLVTAIANAVNVGRLEALLEQPGEPISRLFLFGDASLMAVNSEWQTRFISLFQQHDLEGSVCMTTLSRRSSLQPLDPWKAGSLGELAGWLHQSTSLHLT